MRDSKSFEVQSFSACLQIGFINMYILSASVAYFSVMADFSSSTSPK